MAQHDYTIANQSAPTARADINNALAAIVSQNSGASSPSITYANMVWYDTANNILKMRNEADTDWITIATLDQAGGTSSAAVTIACTLPNPLEVAQAMPRHYSQSFYRQRVDSESWSVFLHP